jgi:hypothetical protein
MASGERYAPVSLLAARPEEARTPPLNAKEREIIGRVGHGLSNAGGDDR